MSFNCVANSSHVAEEPDLKNKYTTLATSSKTLLGNVKFSLCCERELKWLAFQLAAFTFVSTIICMCYVVIFANILKDKRKNKETRNTSKQNLCT